jgi:transcription elongation factor Elf1
MQGEAGSSTSENGNGDVFFQCEHCGTSLVVDTAAVGMTLKCQRCGEPTKVPHSFCHDSISSPERLAELKRHLRENESQRTEVKGYINQLGIQLHRWQLRLRTLDKRNKELTDEIAGCRSSENEQR